MEIPLIDLNKADEIEDSSAIVPGLKPLQWNVEELKERLQCASAKLEKSLQRQKIYKKQIQTTVDRIMTYHSELSECEEERQEVIKRISNLRFGKSIHEIYTDVEDALFDLVHRVCCQDTYDKVDITDDLEINDVVTTTLEKANHVTESDVIQTAKTINKNVVIAHPDAGDVDGHGDFTAEQEKKLND